MKYYSSRCIFTGMAELKVIFSVVNIIRYSVASTQTLKMNRVCRWNMPNICMWIILMECSMRWKINKYFMFVSFFHCWPSWLWGRCGKGASCESRVCSTERGSGKCKRRAAVVMLKSIEDSLVWRAPTLFYAQFEFSSFTSVFIAFLRVCASHELCERQLIFYFSVIAAQSILFASSSAINCRSR